MWAGEGALGAERRAGGKWKDLSLRSYLNVQTLIRPSAQALARYLPSGE